MINDLSFIIFQVLILNSQIQFKESLISPKIQKIAIIKKAHTRKNF